MSHHHALRILQFLLIKLLLLLVAGAQPSYTPK
jgi:hypothetical protein